MKFGPTAHRLALGLAAAAITLSGCGGDAEPTVTIFNEMAAAPESLFTAPNASQLEEAKLRAAGIRYWNKRCAQDSFMRQGQLVLFVDGIPPQYVIFDIAESDLPKAEALHYIRNRPEYDTLAKPFYTCESRGF